MIDVKTYIESEMEYDSVKNNENGVLDYLNSLTDEDIEEIELAILNDDELQNKINEITDYYLYHFRKWGNSND